MMYQDDKIIVKKSNIDKYGKGLYTKKDFSIGDIILVEEPFYIVNGKMNKNIMNKIFELKDSVENDNKTGDINKKIFNILNTNRINLDGNGYGLFTIISRINHSCISNVRYFWNSIEKKEYIIAVRDIKKDEEITVSYGETILMSYDERKQYLFNWNFTCDCLICKDNEIDLIKKKLKKLDDMISSLSLQHKFDIAFNCAEKMLGLTKNTLLEEDLLFKNKIYNDMYQLLMYQMNVSKANIYLEKYLILAEIIEKKNSQNYIKKKRYIKNPKLFMMDKIQNNQLIKQKLN
jgi:hypothetical protein